LKYDNKKKRHDLVYYINKTIVVIRSSDTGYDSRLKSVMNHQHLMGTALQLIYFHPNIKNDWLNTKQLRD